MEIGHITQDLSCHVERLQAARASVREPVKWYPYDTLGNLPLIDRLLTDEFRELDSLSLGRPVADIGAADGDLAFVLEAAAGWEMDIIDTAASNHNGLRGAHLLKDALGSSVSIHDIDLDQQFRLPRDDYGLVMLLGILYHLQNPFYVMRELSKRTRYCLLNTRVARLAGPERTSIAQLPVAYLVGPAELNDDATNYWVFTPAGLVRLVVRTGWDVISQLNLGDTEGSVPDSMEHDERMLMLLRCRG
jgi:hypothetical protein